MPKPRKLDPATAKPGEHADDAVRLLRLFVSPTGTRSWRVRLRPRRGERARRLTLGYWPDVSQEAARSAALIAHSAFRENADPVAKLAAQQPRTVGEAIEEYLKSPMALRGQKVSDVYREGMERVLRVPVGEDSTDYFAGIRNKPIAEVRRRDLEILKGTAPLEHMRKIRVFFSWAARMEHVEQSPAVAVRISLSGIDKRSLLHVREDGSLDWREVVGILRGLEKYAEERPDSIWPAVYKLGLFTAMRPQEVVRQKWEHVDLDSEFPKIEVDGKTGERVIPLARAAVAVLRDVQPDAAKREGWIFPCERSESGHLTIDGTAHRRIMKLSGVKKWSRKHLRKVARTWFGARQQQALGRLALGHSLKGMDEHYDLSNPAAAIRKGMDEFCSEVLAQTNPPTPGLRLVA
jgi:integrase